MAQGFKNKRSVTPSGGASAAAAPPKKGARHIPPKRSTAVAQARIEKQVSSAHRVRVESAMLARAKGALGSGGGGGGGGSSGSKTGGSLGAFKLVKTMATASGTIAAGMAAKERRSGLAVSERKSRRAQDAKEQQTSERKE